ncbi:MAG: RNA polymerase sigma factor [Kiritimatiellaeota bacterium]|nr:RNA polymerase sigma factor [Kiritimatiellota bacterium]
MTLDHQIISLVMTEHENALLRFAAGFLRDHSLAQDAVQEAFVSLARQETLPVGDHLRNWLFKTTRNKALDILRKETRRIWHQRKAAEESNGDIPAANGADENDDSGETEENKLRALAAALPKLNNARREVLLLRLQQGLAHEQIAKITGHSPGHCRKLLHEAVAQLRKLVKLEQ